MHLQLQDIKAETFGHAEQNVTYIQALLEFEGAADAFVFSPLFYRNGLNGAEIAKHTFLGRFLCFSALLHETKTWRQVELNQQFHRMKPDHLQKQADKLSMKFHKLHGAVAEIIKKLLVK